MTETPKVIIRVRNMRETNNVMVPAPGHFRIDRVSSLGNPFDAKMMGGAGKTLESYKAWLNAAIAASSAKMEDEVARNRRFIALRFKNPTIEQVRRAFFDIEDDIGYHREIHLWCWCCDCIVTPDSNEPCHARVLGQLLLERNPA